MNEPRESTIPTAPTAVISAAVVRRGGDWLFALALATSVLLVYRPAWHGGLIWDDDQHLTRPELQSLKGLWRIWSELGATRQYYPLTHTVFWIQQKLWGENPLGYHLVNIILHCVSAALLFRLLRRLKVPGAHLAAAIFALHPVQVESVAWISELKNTLSTPCYLAAMLAYLRFDRTRDKPWYFLALLCFALALSSKTVTATLPAAMLLIFWWQRGGLGWRRDVLPLLPFFAFGSIAGCLTAWAERKLGAEGRLFDFGLLERFLIAGRVVWFYLAKLLWPVDLIFIYPRWQVSERVWWQYLFPLAAAGLLWMLWRLRQRARAPLAAALFFGGTLFPVLGFFNVYPFRFSWVADHFQYLAGVGVIVPAATLITAFFEGGKCWPRAAGSLVSVGLLTVLATLSYRQSRMYADLETLYRATIQGNPDCWLAYDNLGNLLLRQEKPAEAVAQFQRALEINPSSIEAHNDLGIALRQQGNLTEAIAQYHAALKINPRCAEAYNNLGNLLWQKGQLAEASSQFQEAIRIEPNYFQAYNNLGSVLAQSGRLVDAIDRFQKALAIYPRYAESLNNLGNVLLQQGNATAAILRYRQALAIRPDFAEAHVNLGNALCGQGEPEEAIAHYRQATVVKPRYADAQQLLAAVLYQQGRTAAALDHWREAIRLQPAAIAALNAMAWALATTPQTVLRDGPHSLGLARKAVQLAGSGDPAILDTLAAAYAETGRFAEAERTGREALALARAQHNAPLAGKIDARIKLYQAGVPYRDAH